MKPLQSIWLIIGVICSMSASSPAVLADDIERLDILRHASVSLSEAIEIALDKFPGYAVEGKLEEVDGMFYYEVELVSDGGQAEVYVHPANGLIIGAESERGIAIRFKRRWAGRLSAVSHSTLSVLDIMTVAHKVAPGRILEFDLKKHQGKYFYRVTIYEGGAEHNIDIKVDTGEIIRHKIGAS